jgi:hypothetical protein
VFFFTPRKAGGGIKAEQSYEALQTEYERVTRRLQRLRQVGIIILALMIALLAYGAYYHFTLPYDPLRDKIPSQ